MGGWPKSVLGVTSLAQALIDGFFWSKNPDIDRQFFLKLIFFGNDISMMSLHHELGKFFISRHKDESFDHSQDCIYEYLRMSSRVSSLGQFFFTGPFNIISPQKWYCGTSKDLKKLAPPPCFPELAPEFWVEVWRSNNVQELSKVWPLDPLGNLIWIGYLWYLWLAEIAWCGSLSGSI